MTHTATTSRQPQKVMIQPRVPPVLRIFPRPLVSQHFVQNIRFSLLVGESCGLGISEPPEHSAHMKHLSGAVGILVEPVEIRCQGLWGQLERRDQ